MDLYLPEASGKHLPVLIYIHGGGWKQGTQYRPPFKPRLFDDGIAVAAITYRFSHEAPFPACLQDCKLMTRWLRAHAGTFGLDPDRFAAWGISAGGHLASLMGTTRHLPDYEGTCGWQEFDSSVLAVCTTCGPSDIRRTAIDPVPGEGMVTLCSDLIGGPLHDYPERAAAASPVTYVSADTVPHLIIQGMEDPIVPAYHASDLHDLLLATGIPSHLLLLPGVGHDIPPDSLDRPVRSFFLPFLKG